MKKKKIIIGVCCLAAVAALFFGIRHFLNAGNADLDGAYVQKVSDMTNSGSASTRFSGIVESEKTVDYKQSDNQTISEIYVTEGQSVSEGDPLFKYDVNQMQNTITSLSIDIEELNNENAALEREIVEIRNAGGDSLSVTTAIQQKQLQIRQNNYSKESKQAELAQNQGRVANAVVKSTLNGTVKSVNDPSNSTDPSKPVVSITQSGDFKVTGKVDETNIGMVSVGQNVIVRSRIDQTKTWMGSVTEIKTEPQTNNNNDYYNSGESTSKYPFTVALSSSNGLILGQHVYIEMTDGLPVHTDGLWLDSYYIAYNEDGSAYVWKANGNKLVKQTVETGDTDEYSQIEIVSGLSKDDEIAYPDESYQEGTKVIRLEDLK